MKNSLKLIGIIAIVAVIGFSMACGGDDDITIITVTGVTLNQSSISLKVGDTETLTATVAPDKATNKAVSWSSSDATKATVSEGVVTAVAEGSATITVTTADGGKTAQCTVTVTSGGGNDVPPENKPVAERWWKWVADDSTATLDYSVDDDGVCTITVGGTAQPYNESDDWGIWKAQAGYDFTAQAGKAYIYTFEAWTQSGNRGLWVQYYDVGVGADNLGSPVWITSTRETYTVYGDVLPKGGRIHQVQFLCADQLGTFYVKILEIKEYKEYTWEDYTVLEETGSITITGYNGVGGNVTIPSQIDGKPVTIIGEWAFYECTSLTGVIIPNSVTSVHTPLLSIAL